MFNVNDEGRDLRLFCCELVCVCVLATCKHVDRSDALCVWTSEHVDGRGEGGGTAEAHAGARCDGCRCCCGPRRRWSEVGCKNAFVYCTRCEIGTHMQNMTRASVGADS
jgi:hypothetical protein